MTLVNEFGKTVTLGSGVGAGDLRFDFVEDNISKCFFCPYTRSSSNLPFDSLCTKHTSMCSTVQYPNHNHTLYNFCVALLSFYTLDLL